MSSPEVSEPAILDRISNHAGAFSGFWHGLLDVLELSGDGLQSLANRHDATGIKEHRGLESNSNSMITQNHGFSVSDTPQSTSTDQPEATGKERSLQLAVAAARVAMENRGSDVMIIDVSEQTVLFDYFVIATGTSRRQLHAISEDIDDALEKGLNDQRMGIEGYRESRWIVLDYGSIVVHMFDDETREYYDLESLWADGKKLDLAELGLDA